MDLHCILVAMFVHFPHGFSLYWSASMMRNHLDMSQKYWCIVESWLMMIFNQDISYLKVITCSFKDLSIHIPLASCFGGDSVTHKSRRHHVSRPKTSKISLNSQNYEVGVMEKNSYGLGCTTTDRVIAEINPFPIWKTNKKSNTKGSRNIPYSGRLM